MTKPVILILGATGRVGGAALRALAGRNDLDTRAAHRRADAVPALAATGATPVHLDLNDAGSIAVAMKGVDRLLLITGYSVDMLRQSWRVLAAAKAAGVSHIVHVGASGNPTAEVAHWGWHRYVEAAIEQAGFGYTHLQPEAYMQNLTAFGWLRDDGTLLNPIGDCAWSWVDADDVGALAAAALSDPDHFAGQTWRMGYEAASMPQVASLVSSATGRPLKLLPLSPEDFYAAGIAGGGDPAYLACVREQFAMNSRGDIADAAATFDANAFRAAVGRPPNDWTSFIRSLA